MAGFIFCSRKKPVDERGRLWGAAPTILSAAGRYPSPTPPSPSPHRHRHLAAPGDRPRHVPPSPHKDYGDDRTALPLAPLEDKNPCPRSLLVAYPPVSTPSPNHPSLSEDSGDGGGDLLIQIPSE